VRSTGALRFLALLFVGTLLLDCRRVDPAAAEWALKVELRAFRDAIDQYYGDHHHYPERLDDLVSSGYLRAMPIDPMTRRGDTWVVVHEERFTGPAPGIIDVHSGSSRRARNGQPYADW
jgi:general secretion pathway protein G